MAGIRAHRLIVVMTASVLLLAGGATAALGRETAVDPITASATVTASPYSFWYGQVNRDGLCRLVSGCVSASGSGDDWTFQVRVDAPGGVQTVPVSVHVLESVPFQRMALTFSMDAALGQLHGDAVLTIAPVGASTRVRMSFENMMASGIAQAAIPEFSALVQPSLTAQLSSLSVERRDSGVKVKVRLVKGKKATAHVAVVAPSATKPAATATGRMRVLVDGNVACTAKVRKSSGSCRFAPPQPASMVRVVVVGKLSNGYPVWNSGQARYPR